MRSVRKRVKATVKRLDNKFDGLKAKVKGAGEQKAKENADIKLDETFIEHADEVQPSAETTALARKASTASKASKASTASTKSNDSNNDRPVFDAPAPALRDEDDDDDEVDENEHAFSHPSTYVDQVWIWIPKDTLGLSEFLTEDLKQMGVDASDVGASMDAKGVVEVSRNPPDEEWNGGHDI